MWRLRENEYVEDENHRIDGPKIVRVLSLGQLAPNLEGFQVQSGSYKVLIQGPNFPSAVKKK